MGMEMITDYVPGAYMTHDMLHMRGGHQTSWLIDGVAIPNTKIASNVGPQIDPKDIDSLERSGAVTRPTWETARTASSTCCRATDLSSIAKASLSSTQAISPGGAVSLGDHSEKSAWYTSLTGYRSNYGLATPVAEIYHDATNSQSVFASLIRNQTAKDQLRVDGQYRQDYFDVPYDPARPTTNVLRATTARMGCATPK